YARALEHFKDDYGYGRAVALGALGRSEDAIKEVRVLEKEKPWRLGRLYLVTIRALLEGNRKESLEASEELMKATFRDPEGMYYLARQLSYLGQEAEALDMLGRAIENGFFCYPAMVRDPWLDGLRTRTEFTGLLRKANALHRQAMVAFL